MQCYRLYTPLWLWYWPWVHNVLQRLAWGKKKKIQPTQQGGRKTRATDVWAEAEASKGTAKTQGARCGSHAIGDWSEDLWKAWRAKLRSYGTWRGGHVWDVGLHVQKRGWACGVTWITGHRRWSRYGESPRRRNVRDWGRRRWAAQESPAGCGCTKGSFV